MKFELNDKVRLVGTDVKGYIGGCAEYLNGDQQYLFEYLCPKEGEYCVWLNVDNLELLEE